MALVILLVFAVIATALYYYLHRPQRDELADYIEQAEDIVDAIDTADDVDVVDQCLDSVVVGGDALPVKRLRSKALYSKYVVNLAKNRFGSMARNQANMSIVRKFVLDEMVEHGVIARHIRKTIDAIVELVFVHSEDELVALAIRHTEKVKKRARVARALAGPPEAA
jgi:hypothetical protein